MVEKKYKLIKLDQGFILVSDETPIIDDFALYGKYIRKVDNTFNQPGMDWNALNTRKIIASNFIFELPLIDFNGLEEEFGIPDVEKICESEFHIKNPSDETLWKKALWKDGFNKCLELNKDKLYTLDQLRFIYNTGIHSTLGELNHDEEFNKVISFIQSLQPKSEWNVEVSKEKDLIKILNIVK